MARTLRVGVNSEVYVDEDGGTPERRLDKALTSADITNSEFDDLVSASPSVVAQAMRNRVTLYTATDGRSVISLGNGTLVSTLTTNPTTGALDAAGVVAVADVFATIVAPKPSGADDINADQALIDAASVAAIGLPVGQYVRVLFRGVRLHSRALIRKPGVWIDGPATFVKTANGTGAGGPTNYTHSMFMGLNQQINGSYYGSDYNWKCTGITFDTNKKYSAYGHINLMNSEWAEFHGNKIIVYGDQIKSCFSSLIGGRHIKGYGNDIINGDMAIPLRVGQDGWHYGFGDDIEWRGGFAYAGDDALAYGMEPGFPLGWDDQPLTNIRTQSIHVHSYNANALKFYYPTHSESVTNKYKIDGIVISGVTGYSGIYRNGGVVVNNGGSGGTEVASDLIKNISVDGLDITVGSASHSGINPYPVWAEPCKNVKVRGTMRVFDTASANPVAGYRKINVSASTLTNTGYSAGSTYTATVTVDSAPIALSVLGSDAPTIADLINQINANPTFATAAVCSWDGNAIMITSKTKGASSTVAVTPGTLFAGSWFVSIDAGSTAGVDDMSMQCNIDRARGFGWGVCYPKCTRKSGQVSLSDAIGFKLLPETDVRGLPAGSSFIVPSPSSTRTTVTICAGARFDNVGTSLSYIVNPVAIGRLRSFFMSGVDLSANATIGSGGNPAVNLTPDPNNWVSQVPDYDVSGNFWGFAADGTTRKTPVRASGKVTLASGSTATSNVTHNLGIRFGGASASEVNQRVTVKPRGSLGSATSFRVEPVDATSFVIKVNVAPGVAVDFDWEATTERSVTVNA